MSQKKCIQCGLPTDRIAFIGSGAAPFCKDCSGFNKEKESRETTDKVKEIIIKTVKKLIILL